jgi:hypothetical protein
MKVPHPVIRYLQSQSSFYGASAFEEPDQGSHAGNAGSVILYLTLRNICHSTQHVK